MLVQRVAAAVGNAVLGQDNGKVLFRHRYRAVLIAVDDGDGRAPVALAADTPVAQAPGGLLLAQALGGQVAGHGVHRGFVGQPVVGAGGHDAGARLVRIPLVPARGVVRALALHGNHLPDRDAVLQCEGEVAFVVRRHAHHGTVAVAHEHVVAHPHVYGSTRERVRHRQARAHALLFLRGEFGLGGAASLAFLDEGGHRGVGFRRVHRQRVLGRDGAEGHAHYGVGTRGEDVHPAVLQRLTIFTLDVVREGEAHALALADPVLLHQLHTLGPARQVVLHVLQQLGRVLRDLQVVAGDLALFHQGARAPAAAVDHLLVGQHGLVHRVPVHHLGAALGDAGLQHLQEQPLVPLVVLGRAGRDLAAPVDGQAHGQHLSLHVGDVVVGPLRGGYLVLHRRVFRGQAEGVPAHGHEHVEALHPQMTGQHVVDGVVAHVPHVQLAAGVGQHGAGVELLLARVFGHAVDITRVPIGMGRGFHLGGDVLFIHPGIVGAGVLRKGLPYRPGRGAEACQRGALSVTKPMRDSPPSCTRPMSSATRP